MTSVHVFGVVKMTWVVMQGDVVHHEQGERLLSGGMERHPRVAWPVLQLNPKTQKVRSEFTPEIPP